MFTPPPSGPCEFSSGESVCPTSSVGAGGCLFRRTSHTLHLRPKVRRRPNPHLRACCSCATVFCPRFLSLPRFKLVALTRQRMGMFRAGFAELTCGEQVAWILAGNSGDFFHRLCQSLELDRPHYGTQMPIIAAIFRYWILSAYTYRHNGWFPTVMGLALK